MKSDVIKLTMAGDGIEDALRAASDSAAYRGLGKKEALHLRLLTEEMLGMLRQITGGAEANFWVTSEGRAFELHLAAYPLVTGKMRRELLDASTSGKNEAARGFMGKLRDIMDRALIADDVASPSDYYLRGLIMPANMSDPMAYAASANMVSWSMQHYKTAVEQDSGAKEEWDELEKSIVANIADEVKIAITGNTVEMTVYKKFKN